MGSTKHGRNTRGPASALTKSNANTNGRPWTVSLQLVPLLRFQSGPIALGMEWLHSKTDWVVDVGLPTQREEERSGNQLIFSALYTF
jgi:hypothetical protein